jgi:dienelactone hydrolase
MDNFIEYEEDKDRKAIDISSTSSGNVQRRVVSCEMSNGSRRVGQFIYPDTPIRVPAVLYLHGYEPNNRALGRNQFHDEGVIIAQRGLGVFLIEAMWADQDWFLKRTQEVDRENILRQVAEILNVVELLRQEIWVESSRIGFVGHGLGAMCGVIAGSVALRFHCCALIACAPRFIDWDLGHPEVINKPEQDSSVILQDLDPVERIGELAPTPILFQFGLSDPHVPVERATRIYNAAQQSKEIRWYRTGHSLNESAAIDRILWLEEHLRA